MTFKIPDYLLSDLIKNIGNGRIQLLDFQREWEWDDDHIVSLIASIAMGYPIGVLMMLEVGGRDLNLAFKPLAGAEKSATGAPEWLLLDGQHRITALFHTLASCHSVPTRNGPVPTRNRPVPTRNGYRKPLTRWCYIDIAKALSDRSDLEDAILLIPKTASPRTTSADPI